MKNLLLLHTTFAITVCCLSCNFLLSGYAIESPEFRAILSESDFEIRLYRESSWISAFDRGTSFENSTKAGFHRLHQYIKGANSNSSQHEMTAPVLTSIVPSKHGPSIYYVRFYLSPTYSGKPPQPNPELNLQIEKWRSHCVAVRKFSGFAEDDNIEKEKEALLSSLNKPLPGIVDAFRCENSYSIAQYNASLHLTGRVNEIWINVSGFKAEGCPLPDRKI